MFDYTYPHTNLSDINLDWFLKRFTEIEHEIITIREELTQAQEDIASNTEQIEHLQNDLNDLIAAYNSLISDFTQFVNNIARPYSTTGTYDIGDYVIYDNILYKCHTAITSGESFDPSKWYSVKVMDEIESGGGYYTLPIASANTLGGVKVGEGLRIDQNGVLSSEGGGYTLPIASANTLGGVKVGNNLSIDENGVLSAISGGGGGTIHQLLPAAEMLDLTNLYSLCSVIRWRIDTNNNEVYNYHDYYPNTTTLNTYSGTYIRGSYYIDGGNYIYLHINFEVNLALEATPPLSTDCIDLSLDSIKIKETSELATILRSVNNFYVINNDTYFTYGGNRYGGSYSYKDIVLTDQQIGMSIRLSTPIALHGNFSSLYAWVFYDTLDIICYK